MPETKYRGRAAFSVEDSHLRLTVLHEGGHIAEILDKHSGVNPLWTPPWPSIEPSTYDLSRPPAYGHDSESKLLAGIMGHNLCMDFFGAPSEEEAAAGLTVHGEASVARYRIAEDELGVFVQATLPQAQLHFERRLQLQSAGVRIAETVENLTACDRPIAWTQHVTLGPPFLEKGATQFRASATKSKVFEGDFGAAGYMRPGAVFDWPLAPCKDQGFEDLRIFTNAPVSGAFSTHLMDPHKETAWFVAFSPRHRLAFGYIWKRADFPWLGRWEENYSRTTPPWNGKTLTCGMEFGVSPMPESRRKMVDRGSLFGVPAYRWIPARSKVHVEYWAVLQTAGAIPETLAWPE